MAYTLQIRGLKGGHSGSDIHLQRASSNKLMGRMLQELCEKVWIMQWRLSMVAKWIMLFAEKQKLY